MSGHNEGRNAVPVRSQIPPIVLTLSIAVISKLVFDVAHTTYLLNGTGHRHIGISIDILHPHTEHIYAFTLAHYAAQIHVVGKYITI